ncbi:hypothetical protein [Stieleria varia]|uniref:Uncharacterized protein n=1 Tax=Stieleria varia TaxID=2528005 RepID=A0A5C6B8I6_9BACT|nr:hypothetical protein [Stieleria varia]TWU07952.1 hypothetical protein Pla52n_05290 [Stieleria varia]
MSVDSKKQTHLSCHLESADSVRTNPERPHFQRQFNRLFAEAFTHLLFGEQLRFGQVPLFDSFGLVQFLAELLDAKRQFERERLGQETHLKDFLPLVMTHYPKSAAGVPFDDPKTVLQRSLADAISNEKFVNSAMPGIGADSVLSAGLSEHVFEKGIRFDAIDQGVLRDLEGLPRDFEHLQRMESIDRYFQANPWTVLPIDWSRKVALADCVREALSPDNIVKGHDDIVTVYQDLVNRSESFSRSNVYEEIEGQIENPDRQAVAKELADSLYMWDQARIAGATAETTSSGVESDDPEVCRAGEEISDWADRSKAKWSTEAGGLMSIRPVLQRGPLNNQNSLDDAGYRQELLRALADFIVSDGFQPMLFDTVARLGTREGDILEHWQAMVTRIESHPTLSGLIRLTINSDGIVVIRFGRHRLGAKAPHLNVSPETTDQIRESMRDQEDDPERVGANLPMAMIG